MAPAESFTCRVEGCGATVQYFWQLNVHHREAHPETRVEHEKVRRARVKPGIDRKRFEAGKTTREAFLEAIRTGLSVKAACAEVGWASEQSYYYHRREYPLFAQAIDAERAKRQGKNGPKPKPKARHLSKGEKERRAGHTLGIASIEEAVNAFAEFTEHYFPDRRPHLDQQLRIVAELNNLGPREVCLFLVWPEAGKTATFEDYICRHLAMDPNHRFRIISEAGDLSKRIVGTCARRFTDDTTYKRFIRAYGPFYEKGQERKGKPWTTEQLTVLRNSGEERDRSLVASSWSSAVYGSRIDTLIVDDIQSQRNFGQAEEIFRRVRGTFFNRGLEMRTLIVGTRIGPGDFYDRMLDAGLITKKVIMPAAGHDGMPTVPQFWDQHTMIHDGKACCMGFRTCPKDRSRLSAKEFMDLIRHQSGEDTWWAAYQQNPISDERSTFGRYLDNCRDLNRKIGELPRSA